MSKNILVIDTPISCLFCPCSNILYGNNKCQVNGEELTEDDVYEQKPKWCPLKPIPEKNGIRKLPTPVSLTWIKGWNACRDEILKDEDLGD